MIDQILKGDALKTLKKIESNSVDCVVTSPPYWNLRDYKMSGQIGLEKNFEKYIKNLCEIFDEIKRVLKKEGTCFVNIGDTYAGTMPKKPGDFGKNSKVARGLDEAYSNRGTKNQSVKDKCLIQIPARFAIEMCNRGWALRNEIIWHKPNCMPSSVEDRFTVDFEKIFFFVKNKKYWFEQQLEEYINPINRWGGNMVKRLNGSDEYGMKQRIRSYRPTEEGRNKRTVWSINTKPFNDAHFAVFPEQLAATMIKAGCPEGGLVLDPFLGSGTTARVAKDLGRHYLGIELNPAYIKIAKKRLAQQNLF